MEARDAYLKLAEMLRYPESKELIELLQFLLTPVQAKIAAALPASHADLAKKVGISEGEIDKNLWDMFDRGLVFPKDFSKMDGARFARSLPQLHDANLSDLRWEPRRKPEMAQKWQAFYRSGYDCDHALYFLQTGIPIQRILPAVQAFPADTKFEPWEDIREIVKASSKIAMVACSCRSRQMGAGAECQFADRKYCMQFGRGAEYAIQRGSGKAVSAEEALNLLYEAEDCGLVHQAWNSQSMQGSPICNCCPDCCVDWESFKRYKIPTSGRWLRTRWNAYVEETLCNGCGVCLPRCGFEAVILKDGKAVIDEEKCFGCGACVLQCEPKAITMKLLRPPGFVPKEGLDRTATGPHIAGGVFREGPKLP
jgi:ferredoxin